MQQAVAPCPEIIMSIKGKPTRSLLDSGSEVTLVNESYYREHIEHRLLPTSGSYNNSHNLFSLRGVEEGHVPLSKHFECDIEVGGQLVHRVGILVKKDKIPLVDSKGRKAKTPALLGSNLIRIAVNEFCETFGEDCLRLFECPKGISPLWFSTLCLYYYAHIHKKSGVGASSVQSDDPSKDDDGNNRDNQPLRPKRNQEYGKNSNEAKSDKDSGKSKNTQTGSGKHRNKKLNTLGGYAGRVMVGDRKQPICIPAGTSKVVIGKTQEKLPRGSYMVEATDDDNLPCGVSVNHTYVNPTKAKQVSVILLNTNSYNVWIRQPLYAATIWDVDLKDWDYEPIITKSDEVDTFEVKLQPVPPEDLREEILSNATEVNQDINDASGKSASKEKDEKPSFGARPNTKDLDFDFKKELERLPFELNIGDAPLTRDQQARLIDVIYSHTEVFSLFDGDLGFCDVLKHSIPTTTDKPVYLPHRQIPVQLQSEVRKCLDNWLKQGIIRPSKSPYASQVVIVRKKTGEIRLCVDFRKLNAISIRDSFPLPRVEEALQAVQAAVWFSSFDLAQGYLQMAMEEEDIEKTAFRAGSSGLYEFTRMPFGLTNAGASFCRLMEMCIGDQQYVTLLFYLDDICIFAETADQMLDRIEFVFSRLKEFNLKIKPKKSHFFQTSVTFLGHILSADGVSPNPEKVAKIKDWPTPKTPKEVHSFVGLASYYRRFIPNFAKWAGPLHALIVPASFKQKIRRGEMKKSDLPEFQWTPACQEGFDQLKKALTEAPVLAYPDYSKPFILETDASLKGLGAVLSQKGDDNEIRVVAYASRSLRPSEKSMRDYSSAKIELMALKWSVCDKFKDYLLGSKFTVFTDNNPLCYIKSSKLGAAQIRWLSELALYDFDIVYRTGKSNLVADALSRRPEVEEEIEREVLPESDDEEWIAVSYQVEEQGGRISSMEFNQVISELVGGTKIDKKLKDRIQVTDVAKEKLNGNTIEVATGMVSLFDSITPKEMAEFQRQDNQIAPIFTYVKQDHKPSKKVTYQIRSKLARKLALQWDRLILKQGVLHRLYIFNEMEYHQLVLPQRYHRKVLTALHDHMGHQGIDRTLDLLRERVYWPSMAKDAQDWVTNCRRCQIARGDYNQPKPKIGHLEAHNPLDLVCLDFTKIDPSKTGKENVLVITDAFTKFSLAVCTPNQTAKTVAKILVEKWFHVYGVPTRIHSDQGRCFDSNIIKALCKMYGVEQSFTSPYNPRGNAFCERFNRTLFGLLKTLKSEEKADWPSHLPALVFAYNATPHASTGYQPYQLMFGRRAPAPCDNWLGLRAYNDDKSITRIDWVDQQLEQLLHANKRAQKNIKATNAKNRKAAGGKDLIIPVGNLVLLRDHPEGRNKIQDNNKDQIYIVTGHHDNRNAYFVKPLGSKCQPKQVNRREMFDLGITKDQELERQKQENEKEEEDETSDLPLYNPAVSRKKDFIERPYNLRPRNRKTANSQAVSVSTRL